MYEIISNYLNEEFGLWGIIIFVFVIILLIPILIAIISKFFEIQFFTNWLLKKKNKLWIRIFRNDKSISMCLNEYRQLLKSSEGAFTFLLVYLGLLFGFLLPFLILIFISIIVLIFIENILQSDYFFIYALSLSNLIFSLIPFRSVLYLSNRVKVIKHNQLESEVKIFNNFFIFVRSFSFSFAAYFLVVCYSILLDLINLNPSELNFYLISFINIMAFIFLFVSISELISCRNRFLYSIQTLFNKKWFKKFPKLCIITLGGVQIDGRVNDAFNTDYIILNKNGNQIITLWSSVASIEFLTH